MRRSLTLAQIDPATINPCLCVATALGLADFEPLVPSVEDHQLFGHVQILELHVRMRNQKSTVVARVPARRKLSRHLSLWLGNLRQTFGLAKTKDLCALYADVDLYWSFL